MNSVPQWGKLQLQCPYELLREQLTVRLVSIINVLNSIIFEHRIGNIFLVESKQVKLETSHTSNYGKCSSD